MIRLLENLSKRYNSYKTYTAKADNWINANIVKIPKGLVEASLTGFALSFLASIALAKKDHLKIGLIGGAMGIWWNSNQCVFQKGDVKLGITGFALGFLASSVFAKKNHFRTGVIGGMISIFSNGNRCNCQKDERKP